MLTVRSIDNPVSRAPTTVIIDVITDKCDTNRQSYAEKRREPGAGHGRATPTADAARQDETRITTRKGVSKAEGGSVSRRSARSDESTHHLLAIEFDDIIGCQRRSSPHALGLSPLHTLAPSHSRQS